MNPPSIDCPKCGSNIELTEAITQPLEKKFREFYTSMLALEKEKMTHLLRSESHMTRAFDDKLELELKELKSQVADKDRRLREAEANELEFRKHRQEDDKRELELKDLRGQVADKDRRVREAEANELKLRKQQQDLEDREKSLQLRVQRFLATERKKIWEEASKRISEEHQLRDAQKEQTIIELAREIEDLKREGEQGPPKDQRSGLEAELNLIEESLSKLNEVLKSDRSEAHPRPEPAIGEGEKATQADQKAPPAIGATSDEAVAHAARATTLRLQRRFTESEKEFLEAIKLRPDFAGFYAGMAETLDLEEKKKEAQAYRAVAERLGNWVEELALIRKRLAEPGGGVIRH